MIHGPERTGKALPHDPFACYALDMTDPGDGATDAVGGKSVLTYADAGVSIDAGNEAVRRISQLVATTRRPEQLDAIGGFAGMMRLPAHVKNPVLVSCTDGVGTKLLVAIAAGRHHTVGIDLVAMNVNDLVVTGAEPLFVLDYVATGRIAPEHIEHIVAGVCEGCRQAGASLIGGETAELPGMYADGHYDLAATAVGVVDETKALGPARVREGDVVLALPSSGLHSNGYSLARKALLSPEHGGLDLGDPFPGDTARSVADVLLEPTRIYVKPLLAAAAIEGEPLHAAAHITGGGLIENPPRALPEALAVRLDLTKLDRPAVFRAIEDQGVDEAEMRRTFNCGVGMLLYVAADGEAAVAKALEHAGQPSVAIGRVVTRDGGPPVRFEGE